VLQKSLMWNRLAAIPDGSKSSPSKKFPSPHRVKELCRAAALQTEPHSKTNKEINSANYLCFAFLLHIPQVKVKAAISDPCWLFIGVCDLTIYAGR
jgi:hypothetical protein